MQSPRRKPLVCFTRLKRLGKKWIYLPGGLLMLLGISILLYPRAIPWILAALFVGSGALLIQATRVLRRTFEAFQKKMSDAYIEQMVEEEKSASLENPDHFLTWLN